MSTITPILIATLIGSVGALAGGTLLLLQRKFPESVVHLLVSFAAGALLGTALFEIIPEAVHHAEEVRVAEAGKAVGDVNVFFWVLLGVLVFYLLERAIHWFQYHRKVHKGTHGSTTVPLIMLGDSMHNFIDGIAIAITYMVNPSLGLITTLAIVAHELPQEIGDFAVLLHAGLSRKKVFLFNLASALLAVIGALLTLAIGERIEGILPYALGLTGGFFLYIALTNLIPEIHREEKKGYAFLESIFLFLGVFVIWLAVTYLHAES